MLLTRDAAPTLLQSLNLLLPVNVTLLDKQRYSEAAVADFLREINHDFDPPLDHRAALDKYASKIYRLAVIIVAEVDGELAGLVAFYCNDAMTRTSYITILGVHPEFRGRGVATQLVGAAKEHALANDMSRIRVRTWKANHAAMHIYSELGFELDGDGEVFDNGVESVYLSYQDE